MNFDYYIPTRILFGAGRLNDLHKQKLPGKKALIVISNGKSTRANGYLARWKRNWNWPARRMSCLTRFSPTRPKTTLWKARLWPGRKRVTSCLVSAAGRRSTPPRRLP